MISKYYSTYHQIKLNTLFIVLYIYIYISVINAHIVGNESSGNLSCFFWQLPSGHHNTPILHNFFFAQSRQMSWPQSRSTGITVFKPSAVCILTFLTLEHFISILSAYSHFIWNLVDLAFSIHQLFLCFQDC